jgi:phage terminase large subunit-like protein
VAGPLGGQHFKLEPWQAFLTTTIFGWKSRTTGLRRFARSVVFAGKGNGKSFLSSAWSLYMLCGDGEQGAQVYAAARSESMARIVYDVSYQQVVTNEELRTAASLKAMKKGIEHGPSGSVMKTVSGIGKGSAGLLPYFVVIDETWSHKNSDVVEEMRRGCAKRPGSLMSTISHCGSNLASVGHMQWEEACAILSKELVDERTFVCLWSGCDHTWTSPDAWKAANPNLGISVDAVELETAARLAEKLPSQQGIFRSHNLCCWQMADTTWIDPEMLVACREKNLKKEIYRLWHVGEPGTDTPDQRRPFALGVDLASTQDMAAVVWLTMAYRDGKEHWFCWGTYYSPENTVATSPNAKLKGWKARGLLTAHPGYVNDYDAIQQDILKEQRRNLGYGVVENPDGFNIILCAHDRYQAEHMRQNLEKAGVTSVPVPMQAPILSPAMDWLASLILTSRFHFDSRDEILLWAFSNVVCHRDRNSNLFPNKASEDRKIDPVVALILACKAAMANGGTLMRPCEQDSPRLSLISLPTLSPETKPEVRP